MQKSKLSGHYEPGRMIHKLEYLKKTVARTETGHDRSEGYEVVASLRAQRLYQGDDDTDQRVIVMKETEVQYIYFVHRYRSTIKQSMRVRDEDGTMYTVIGWVDVSPRRWMKVKLQRVDEFN